MNVELLDDLVEGAQDLHVAELCIAVQIFVFLLFLCTCLVSLQQVLDCQADRAYLFRNVLLGLSGDYIAVQKVLRDRIHTFFDRSVDDLFLHSLFVLCVEPERQTELDCVVHVHDRVLPELQLADEPLQVENAI